jgi:hypothetical protein
MKWLPTAALALFAAAPAFAANTMIDFENVTSFASISEYYNGGTDSAGSAGPALGVSFSGDALALANDAAGPYFSNAPSPIGVMAPVGTDATMSVAAGFLGVSFYYSSSAAVAGAVQVWSGLDGGGTLLASYDLASNAQSGGCSDSAYCHFDVLGSSFAGTAHSMTFGNAVGTAAFDNVSITAVPEPSSVLLMALGLGCLGLVARRRA